MKGIVRRWQFTLAACAVGMTCYAIEPVSSRPEPNAFLDMPAHTTQQLIQQVRSKPDVRQRFMQHFQMSEGELIEYLSSLKLVTLERDGYYPVYNSNEKTGVISSRIFHLKKGALVWADPAGTLVLKKGCGNPMSTGPRNALSNPTAETQLATLPSRDLMQTREGQPEPLPLIPAEEIIAPTFVLENLPPEVTMLPPQPSPAEQIPLSHGAGFPWPILAAPLLFTLNGGGDRGGTTGGETSGGTTGETSGGTTGETTGGTTGGSTGGGETIPGPLAVLPFIVYPLTRKALSRRNTR
jgi:hypothetical protein